MTVEGRRRRTALRASKGLCSYCGIHPARPGKKMCIECTAKDTARVANRRSSLKATRCCVMCAHEPASPNSIVGLKCRQRKRTRELSVYGISLEEYHGMEEMQKGRCRICQRSLRLVVDHNHQTGKVRSLLCLHCNAGLGDFQDNPALLHAAADYLVNSCE